MNAHKVIFLINRAAHLLSNYSFSCIKNKINVSFIAIIGHPIESDIPQDCIKYIDKIYRIPLLSGNYYNKSFSIDSILPLIREETKNYKAENIHVISLNEFTIEIGEYIRNILGINKYCDDINIFRNKLKMKSKLNQFGIKTPTFTHFNKLEYSAQKKFYFNDLKKRLNLPFVVKPIDAAGSLGVNIINNFTDFYNLEKKLLSHFQYEAEEYLTGNLFHYDSYIHEGKNIVSFLSRYNYPLHYFQNGKNIGSIPYLNKKLEEKFISLNNKIISAMNIKFGILHTEYFYDNAKDEITFLEMTLRPPGGYIISMYSNTFGCNLIDLEIHMMLKLAYTRNISDKFNAWLCVPPLTGKIKKLHIPPSSVNLDVHWHYKEGDLTILPLSLREKAATIFITSNDKDLLYNEFIRIGEFSFVEY